MNEDRSRRRFLYCAGTTALGAALFPTAACKALEMPGSRFTMGLSQYSLRALFKTGQLDPLDYPQFSVDNFGLKAIDYWEGGLPEEKLDDMAYLEKIRGRAASAGTDLFLLMTGSVDGAAKHVEANKDIVQAMKRAQVLGAPYLRVFLKAPGDDVSGERSLEALKPLADAAAEHGLKLAIEPGTSKLTQSGAYLAKVCEGLAHPNCVLMPDFGKLRGDIYAGTRAMMPFAEVVSCKMHSFDEAGQQPDFDYVRLMKIILDSSYKGILAIEWEGKVLEPIPGVQASQALIAQALKLAMV